MNHELFPTSNSLREAFFSVAIYHLPLGPMLKLQPCLLMQYIPFPCKLVSYLLFWCSLNEASKSKDVIKFLITSHY